MEDRSPRQLIGIIIVLAGLVLGVMGIANKEERQGFWAIAGALFLISGLFIRKE